eukprot:TRINITY_DN6078_c0_g1_i1.p1 TRINITY_DN6078_c0_g1~~TRINITY_DN6078_c0_g1_i1.p1  ORF type:complete len:806 (-),score=132.21 TRINITY_DN6078_c0_g1_i1:164-2581(-)
MMTKMRIALLVLFGLAVVHTATVTQVIHKYQKTDILPTIFEDDATYFTKGFAWQCAQDTSLPVMFDSQTLVANKVLDCLQNHAPRTCSQRPGLEQFDLSIVLVEGEGRMESIQIKQGNRTDAPPKLFLVFEVPSLCHEVNFANSGVSVTGFTTSLSGHISLATTLRSVVLKATVSAGTLELANKENYIQAAPSITLSGTPTDVMEKLKFLVFHAPTGAKMLDTYSLTVEMGNPGEDPLIWGRSALTWAVTPPAVDTTPVDLSYYPPGTTIDFTGRPPTTASSLSLDGNTLTGAQITVTGAANIQNAVLSGSSISLPSGSSASLSGSTLAGSSTIASSQGSTVTVDRTTNLAGGTVDLSNGGNLVINSGSTTSQLKIFWKHSPLAAEITSAVNELATLLNVAANLLTAGQPVAQTASVWSLDVSVATTIAAAAKSAFQTAYTGDTTLSGLGVDTATPAVFGTPYQVPGSSIVTSSTSTITIQDSTALELSGPTTLAGSIDVGANALILAGAGQANHLRRLGSRAVLPQQDTTYGTRLGSSLTVSGDLVVNTPVSFEGATVTGQAIVQAAGELKGYGTVQGALSVAGKLVTGPTSNAQLQCASATFATGSTWTVAFSPAGFTRLVITGALTVNTGATLGYSGQATYAPTAGATLILASSTQLTGSFTTSAVAFAGHSAATPVQSATGVVVTVPTATPPPPTPVGSPPPVVVSNPPPTTTTSEPPSSSSSSSSNGWIAGAVVGPIGGVLLIAAVAGVVFYVHKQKAAVNNTASVPRSPASKDAVLNVYSDESEFGWNAPPPTPDPFTP